MPATQTALLLVLAAAVNSTIGNLLLKLSRVTTQGDAGFIERMLTPAFGGAVFFYAVNLVLFAKALDSIPVSVGYPILAASGFALLAVTSAIFFGERFGIWQAAGILLVIGGIVCLARP